MFKTKLFSALFYIPGIKFNLSNSDEDFPDIPKKYISGSRPHNNCDGYVTCFTSPENMLYLWFGSASNNSSRCWHIVAHRPVVGISCDQLSSDYDIPPIAKYLLGSEWKKLLDDSTYNIQKNRFIQKYHLKRLIIESLECFSIIKYVLISKWIELELPDETTQIARFCWQSE